MIEVDTTLFRISPTLGYDSYSEATRYYRAAGTSRRRGLYYTTATQIIDPPKEYLLTPSEPLSQSSITLYSAQSGYRVGLRASHAQKIWSGWHLSSSLWGQTGRDLFVEGLFRNTISPEATVSKIFGDNHFLSINASLNIANRGLQYGSTAEAFELTGNNYYNPNWGLYNGKVRNSRTRRNFSPKLSMHYQRPIDSSSTLIVEGNSNYTNRATSSLGWYNATTPLPDYYSKMPSYLPQGEIQDYVTTLWRTNNTDYTQINWDEMVRLNSLSPDGNAYYLLEERVERVVEARASAIIRTQIDNRVILTYGLEGGVESSRNFKTIKDLLGASHYTDYDYFMGDDYNKSLPLQNDLNNPDNVVGKGDRFGYDYSLYHSEIYGVLRAEVRCQLLDVDIEAKIGDEKFYRTGHFEKERFANESSYGRSNVVGGSPYTLRASVGFAASPTSYFALKLLSTRLSPNDQNLYLNAMSANFLAPSLEGERVNFAAIHLHLNYPRITISGEIYAHISRNGSSIYSLYDDLSQTMTRASVTEIGYCAYGVELTSAIRLHHDLRFTTTLTAGRSYYDTEPYIELFDDYDLSTISSPTPSQMSGLNIGNTPQITSTANLTYFGISNYIFNLSASYSALRYEQPSFSRRSERVLTQAFLSSESQAAALKQERLDDILDMEIGASRHFWMENGGNIYIRASIKNLLGDRDRIYYARESNRINIESVDDYFTGSTPRESSYQYGSPRTITISIGYRF